MNSFLKGRGRLNILGFIISGMLGVLLHFLNDLINVPVFLKFLAATDESVFEHLKLYFFPVMAVTLGQYFIERGSEKNGLELIQQIGNRSIATLIVTAVQIIFFYGYTVFIPPNPVIDIAGYFVFLAAIFFISNMLNDSVQKKTGTAAFVLLLLFLRIFTYYKPDLPLFAAP